MAKLKLNIKKPSEQAAEDSSTTLQGAEITAPTISLPDSGGIRIILKNAKIHAEKVIIKKVEK